jgi:hypothetical protein
MKAKLKGAETGHSLLKRKSEALTKYVVFDYPSLAVLTDGRRFRGINAHVQHCGYPADDDQK